MTARTRQSLKNIFENGDETSTANFSDLIDSFLNFSDTSAQTVLSPVTLSALKFTTASGTTLETRTITTSGLRVTGTLSADTALVAMGDVSASSINITASVSASSLDVNSLFVNGAPPDVVYGGIQLITPTSVSSITRNPQSAGSPFSPVSGSWTAHLTQSSDFSAITTGQLKYKGTDAQFMMGLVIQQESGDPKNNFPSLQQGVLKWDPTGSGAEGTSAANVASISSMTNYNLRFQPNWPQSCFLLHGVSAKQSARYVPAYRAGVNANGSAVYTVANALLVMWRAP